MVTLVLPNNGKFWNISSDQAWLIDRKCGFWNMNAYCKANEDLEKYRTFINLFCDDKAV